MSFFLTMVAFGAFVGMAVGRMIQAIEWWGHLVPALLYGAVATGSRDYATRSQSIAFVASMLGL